MIKRENCARDGVRARKYGVSSGKLAESETVEIYCIKSAVSGIYEIVRNFVVSSSEPCRTINSGKFPFFESVKRGGCPRTPLYWESLKMVVTKAVALCLVLSNLSPTYVLSLPTNLNK